MIDFSRQKHPFVRWIFLLAALAIACGCLRFEPAKGSAQYASATPLPQPGPAPARELSQPLPCDSSELERRLIAAGLVNVQQLHPGIQVELKYNSTDNFMGENVYNGLCRCYLQPSVAEKLVKAQKKLETLRPGLHLRAYDCARPRAVQIKMWGLVKGTAQAQYVADPKTGSLHNYGACIDLSIADSSGAPLDMGTAFDFFGPLAQPRYEEKFLNSGALNAQQIENRRLLRTVMRSAGFQGLLNEWWHFNGYPLETTKSLFRMIE